MSVPPNVYRLCWFDGVQRNVIADLIEAATDEEAIASAESSPSGTKCEIWHGQRLVAQIDSERRQA